MDPRPASLSANENPHAQRTGWSAAGQGQISSQVAVVAAVFALRFRLLQIRGETASAAPLLVRWHVVDYAMLVPNSSSFASDHRWLLSTWLQNNP